MEDCVECTNVIPGLYYNNIWAQISGSLKCSNKLVSNVVNHKDIQAHLSKTKIHTPLHNYSSEILTSITFKTNHLYISLCLRPGVPLALTASAT